MGTALVPLGNTGTGRAGRSDTWLSMSTFIEDMGVLIIVRGVGCMKSLRGRRGGFIGLGRRVR